MELPKLKFWFDYGCCLWSDIGAVNIDNLPISDSLKRELEALGDEFWDYLDDGDPGGPPAWTREQTCAFFDRAEPVCKKLEEELRGKYTVINRLDDDRKTGSMIESDTVKFTFTKINRRKIYERIGT